MREEMLTYRYGNSDAPVILIQMVGDHELPGIENEIREIRRLTDQEFAFVAVKVENWNQDLSPWKASAVFGKEEFGDGAARTLKEVLNICTDQERKYCIGGYSLAGLFALWACCKTDLFSREASVSGSLWFPGFAEYLDENLPQGALDVAYLSLGKKEHKTPNRMMREVLADTKRCEQTLQDRGAKTLFECNPGNHFSEPPLRSAKGIA